MLPPPTAPHGASCASPSPPRYATKSDKCVCAGGYGGDGKTCAKCAPGSVSKGGSLTAKCKPCKSPKVSYDGIKCVKPGRRLLMA